MKNIRWKSSCHDRTARTCCAALLSALAFFLGGAPRLTPAEAARVPSAPVVEGGRIVLEARTTPPPVPVFFSAKVDELVTISFAEIAGTIRLDLHVVQGRAETIALGLSGEGEIVDVTGDGLRDWSVRRAGDQRFLDLHPQLPVVLPNAAPAGPTPAELHLVAHTRLRKPAVPGSASVLIVTPGEAVGFAATLKLQPENVDARVTDATGVLPVSDAAGAREARSFSWSGEARLGVGLSARGGALATIELTGLQLAGKVDEAAGSVEFRLRGQLRVQKAGARLKLLAGRAALSEKTAGDGWHAELTQDEKGNFFYELVGDREGTLPVELTFAAPVREDGDWRALDFSIPGGAVVPLQLEGLGDKVSFKTDAPVVPAASGPSWRGFLPADGAAALAWKHARDQGEGALFFTSTEQSEVRIAAGLLRQSAQLSFRILQGKLNSVRCRLDGPGEIVGVDGANVVGWKVVPAEGGRALEIRFSRPLETEGALTIRSQAELGTWPAHAEPLRFTPEGGVRHSGFVRVANNGAVRLEITEVNGLMQLAPAQFPGPAVESGARQVFVYRFPSASYGYRVLATQIQPEVAVSAIATYELTENARVINAALELDVREAPLRDWSLRVPADYTVVSVNGADVSDYVVESETTNATRVLRVLFGREIEGRQLLQLRLEKNQPAAAGEWMLPALQFPGAKTVRGHVGAVSAPGFRLVPARVDRLVEVPLNFFPQQTAGLQQAWRVREPDWSAELRVEALGQSVQADVFHLYSLKEGVVYGSVLLNYFVVGAPASEWRVEVPASLGNIDVTGQNVRRDWRREGDQVIVSLHQPVLGAATLLITFEQPMSARGGAIRPGEVRPLGVQAERGFIQVVSPLQVKHEIRRADGGLLKLESAELPAEFRLFTTSPSLAVYQYTARPFAFEMGVERYAPGDTVEQVVDFAKLSSQVSRDGQVVTVAQFFVKTRGRKALRLVVPANMKLWEARVDNELVNARADGEQTLVPLPAQLNPNEPVRVALRLGQPASGSPTHVRLLAPRAVAAPTVISEWTMRSDAGRLLVPQGGNAELVRPALTETGFEWIAQRGAVGTLVLLAGLALGILFLRGARSWMPVAGMIVCLVVTCDALGLAVKAALNRRVNLRELTYAATVVPAGETLSLDVANVGESRALLVGWGAVAAVAGAALLTARAWPRSRSGRGARLLRVAGVVLLAGGLLAQRGGAVLFFGALGAVVFGVIYVPAVLRWRRAREAAKAVLPPASGIGPAPAVSLWVLVGLVTLALGGGKLHAQTRPIVLSVAALPDGTKPAQAIVQNWSIRGERLFGEFDVTVRGGAGDGFLLLRAPAVLTEFKGDGVRVSKVDGEGEPAAYYVALERDGVATAHGRFELAVTDRTRAIALPTGPAGVQRVTIELDQGGWEFVSPMAAEILPTAGLPENRSGATLVLAPHTAPAIQLQPKRRDLAAEATQFFAEAANLYVPGPGVVNGFARIAVRPVQGRVAELELEVPAGLTVGDVSHGPVGAWRFDPEKRRLHVTIEPAQAGAFKFDVETQLGAGELPFALALQPLRTLGASGEVGMLALAFGGDAQPESVRVADVSAVNVRDFDAGLLPHASDGRPLATLQNVWRYGASGGRVELKVAPVAPEVRVTTRQVISLDDDRLVIAADVHVAITRVGLFKLSFVVPAGLDVEALSGAALNNWTEAQEGGGHVVTLNLNGRTLGDQTFALTLVGAAPRAQEAWPVPRLIVREATRQAGDVLVVPGKGLRLRAVEREKVTQLDPRSVGGMQPGTLAFRLLQDDWVLRLGIEVLEPWITAQALQEVTLREGQTLTRIALRYHVENAAVKHVQVKLPALGDERARTVRATGSAVSDIVRVPDTPDLWEIRFQRGIAGETDVQIEFQGPAEPARAQEAIATPELIGVRQAAQFVAIRGGGRLELEAANPPRGWTRVDWSAVPAMLQSRSDRTVPALCFRVAEPEAPLAVAVRRHEVADVLKLRVAEADLTTLFAPTGASLTAVNLRVDVLEKSTLRVRLPQGARLFSTFVNGQSVAVVRDGDAYLFYVTPNAADERSAAVRLVYAATVAPARAVGLAGPSLSVPLENVTWRVALPPGYELDSYSGGLRLREQEAAGSFGVEDYRSLVSSRRTAEAQQAMTLLQQAGVLLQKGEQEKAGEALSRVSNANVLDEASNEDARVQLRNLKTQQAVLGLNTRRQRLYLDNRADAARNEPLEQAANLNPFMQGKSNFDPGQIDQLLMGNTVEENTALRGIATRIVDQQLAVEPAPGAIEVTLPQAGQMLTFTRSLQVDGAAPLELKLKLAKLAGGDAGPAMLVLLGIGVLTVLGSAGARRAAA
ncbi:MAG TPA: hypothetical protein VHD62_19725 [Opitutaceae bacterium]|nr:hypothetical protein [Opitutaceae bacterium]